MCFEVGDTIAMPVSIFKCRGDAGKVRNASREVTIYVTKKTVTKRILFKTTTEEKSTETLTCLPWANDVVTCSRYAGRCIISGSFSGCYMIIFDVKGDIEAKGGNDRLSSGCYAAHVSDTQSGRQAWDAFVLKNNVGILFGVNPHMAYDDFGMPGWDSKKYDGNFIYCVKPPGEDTLCPVLLYKMKVSQDYLASKYPIGYQEYYVADIKKSLPTIDRDSLRKLSAPDGFVA